MKKRLLSLILVLTVMVGGLCTIAEGEHVDHSENGFVQKIIRVTDQRIRKIHNKEAFLSIANDPQATYLLMSDIDLGVWETPFVFRGVLHGNGYTISYKSPGKMQLDDEHMYGLFSELDGAYIENLRIEAVIDNAYKGIAENGVYIGGLAGRSKNGAYINNVVVDADIAVSTVSWLNDARTQYEAVEAADMTFLGTDSVQTAVGGLIGYAETENPEIKYAATLYACRSTGSIAGADSTGGLVGKSAGAVYLLGCENRAKISGVWCVGGLVGSATGACEITQSANRGDITAYAAFCGGMIGRGMTTGNDLISDSVNLGTILCGALDGMGEFAGQISGQGTIPVERCISAGKLIGKREFASRSSELSDFDMIYVWSFDPETGVPYPRILMGESVNQYRAAFVRNMLDFCLNSENNKLNMYLFEDNFSQAMADSYRKNGLEVAHVFWREFDRALTAITELDISQYQETSLYDTLITDLIMMDENYEQQEQSMYGTLIDAFLEKSAAESIVGENFTFGTDLFKYLASIHAGEADRIFGDLLKLEQNATMDAYLKNAILSDNYTLFAHYTENAGNFLSAADVILGTLSVVRENEEKANYREAARRVYLDSFERYERIFSDFCAVNETALMYYKNPVNALEQVLALDDAIYRLRENIKEEITYNAFEDGYAFFTAAAGTTELILTNVLSNVAGLQMVGYTGAFKAGAQIGLECAEMMGVDDMSYNGLMLNCAGYMADGFQRYVQVIYNDFMMDRSYENALKLNDCLKMYLNLQILSCRYGLVASQNNKIDQEYHHMVWNIETDLHVLVDLLNEM